MTNPERREHTRQVIREFSEITTFARTSWNAFAPEIHPQLTRASIPVLLSISRRQPISATDLICVLNSEKSIISKHVAALKQFGLIETQVAEHDRRITLLSTTPLGSERIAAVREHLVDRYDERFKSFSDAEVEQLLDLLHRFNEISHDHS